ncbi:MAG: GNAT family N-acetyltransferase [Gemmatimonadales bacterium]
MNQLFSDSFTDRYRRDGLVGVRVPQLNPEIWHYAIRDAGDGAMLWFDESDELVAFNIAHHSGVEGWMGPLAVRSDRQGLGVGRAIVQTAVDWLKEAGVRTLGLETMPRTVENIGFYTRLGFVPQHLTMTMTCDAAGRSVRGRFTQVGRLATPDRADVLRRCRDRLARSAEGYDFTRELELSRELDIGDAVVVTQEGQVQGFALWHSAPLAQERSVDELRVLKLFADSPATFEKLVVAAERCARRLKIPKVAIRCQTAFADSYMKLVELGYRVRWTDLRMTLNRFPEVVLPPGEVLFSNWEI